MRAVLCNEWGGPEKLLLKDMPSPAIREGAARIAVHAAGINFADLLLISGQYQEKPAFPFTPGMEVAGVVTEVGAGVNDTKVGDRVMALIGTAAYAEEAIAAADRVYRITDATHSPTSPGLPCAYRTSHAAFAF